MNVPWAFMGRTFKRAFIVAMKCKMLQKIKNVALMIERSKMAVTIRTQATDKRLEL